MSLLRLDDREAVKSVLHGLSLSLVHSKESQLPCCELPLKNSSGKRSLGNNHEKLNPGNYLVSRLGVYFPLLGSLGVTQGPDQHLDYCTPRGRSTHLIHFWISDLQKLLNNFCCFKLLLYGVICHPAMDN